MVRILVDNAALNARIGSWNQQVLAKGLYEEKLSFDKTEDIEVISWHLDQLDYLLEQGEFLEARSMSALYMAR